MEERGILSFSHDFSEKWANLLLELEVYFNKTPDTDAILFLIGIQELGFGPKSYSKEEKQDLIHIATCKVLSYSGFYELAGHDGDGWPIWETVKNIPYLNNQQQEDFLKLHILHYFESERIFQ